MNLIETRSMVQELIMRETVDHVFGKDFDIYDPYFVEHNLGLNIRLLESSRYSSDLILQEAFDLATFWDGVINSDEWIEEKAKDGLTYLKGKGKEGFQALKDTSINIAKKIGAIGKIFWNITTQPGGPEQWIKAIRTLFQSLLIKWLKPWLTIKKTIKSIFSEDNSFIKKCLKPFEWIHEKFVWLNRQVMSAIGWKGALAATGACLTMAFCWDKIKKAVGEIKKYIVGEAKKITENKHLEQLETKKRNIFQMIEKLILKGIKGWIKKMLGEVNKAILISASTGGWSAWWKTVTKVFGGTKFVTDALTPAIKKTADVNNWDGSVRVKGLHGIKVENNMKLTKNQLLKIIRESIETSVMNAEDQQFKDIWYSALSETHDNLKAEKPRLALQIKRYIEMMDRMAEQMAASVGGREQSRLLKNLMNNPIKGKPNLDWRAQYLESMGDLALQIANAYGSDIKQIPDNVLLPICIGIEKSKELGVRYTSSVLGDSSICMDQRRRHQQDIIDDMESSGIERMDKFEWEK